MDDRLDFEGISVDVSDVDSLEEAQARLRELTDISGLTGEKAGDGFHFRARGGSPG